MTEFLNKWNYIEQTHLPTVPEHMKPYQAIDLNTVSAQRELYQAICLNTVTAQMELFQSKSLYIWASALDKHNTLSYDYAKPINYDIT